MASRGKSRLVGRKRLIEAGFNKYKIDRIMKAKQLYARYNEEYEGASLGTGYISSITQLDTESVLSILEQFGGDVNAAWAVIGKTVSAIEEDVREFEKSGETTSFSELEYRRLMEEERRKYMAADYVPASELLQQWSALDRRTAIWKIKQYLSERGVDNYSNYNYADLRDRMLIISGEEERSDDYNDWEAWSEDEL